MRLFLTKRYTFLTDALLTKDTNLQGRGLCSVSHMKAISRDNFTTDGEAGGQAKPSPLISLGKEAGGTERPVWAPPKQRAGGSLKEGKCQMCTMEGPSGADFTSALKTCFAVQNKCIELRILPAGKSLLHALPHPWGGLLTVNDWCHLSKPEQRVSEGWTQGAHVPLRWDLPLAMGGGGRHLPALESVSGSPPGTAALVL